LGGQNISKEIKAVFPKATSDDKTANGIKQPNWTSLCKKLQHAWRHISDKNGCHFWCRLWGKTAN